MSARRARVLVVDDDPTMRLLVGEALEVDGIDVDEASDGSQAIRAFRDHSPDLVLLDVRMPGSDGFAVCGTAITSNRPSSGRPVSLSVAYLAIWEMLAKTRLSNLARLPSSSSSLNGRNRAKDRSTETISLSAPLSPFSKSTATTGVRPN